MQANPLRAALEPDLYRGRIGTFVLRDLAQHGGETS